MDAGGCDRSWGAVVFRRLAAGKLGTTVSVDGSLVSSAIEFLLVKLASGNHWDHPKGHPEKGESPRETASREIQEEGGVEVRFIGDFLAETGWNLPSGRPKKVGYFLAERISDGPVGGPEGEILDVVWLPYDLALERLTYQSGKDVLQKAMDYMDSASMLKRNNS